MFRVFTGSNTFAAFEKMEEKVNLPVFLPSSTVSLTHCEARDLNSAHFQFPGLKKTLWLLLCELYDNLDDKNLSTKYARSSHFCNNFRFIWEKRKQKCHLMVTCYFEYLDWFSQLAYKMDVPGRSFLDHFLTRKKILLKYFRVFFFFF